jgi:hypothetical protein
MSKELRVLPICKIYGRHYQGIKAVSDVQYQLMEIPLSILDLVCFRGIGFRTGVLHQI